MKSSYNPFGKRLQEIKNEDLIKLRNVSEGWYVEYKSQPVSVTKFAKSLSAFANQYGGWLIIGVEEDSTSNEAQEFRGIKKEKVNKIIQELKEASRTCLNPEVYFEHKIIEGPVNNIELDDDKAIIIVYVPIGPEAPYIHGNGRIYQRIADSSEPKPINDRYTLDRLWDRSRNFQDKLIKRIKQRYIVSEYEKKQCFLNIAILSDPYETRGFHYKRSFSEYVNIMKQDPIPFDNNYSFSQGFISRQTANNEAYYRLFTWEFNKQCNTFITLPLNILQGYNAASYEKWQDFLNLIHTYKLESSRIIDLNIILYFLIAITKRHRILVSKANIFGPFYVKLFFDNVWRTIPFLDMPSYINHIKSHGFPIIQVDEISIPFGTMIDSFIKLPKIDNLSYESNCQYNDAAKLFIHISKALGMPYEFAENNAKELVKTGKKFLENRKFEDK